MLLECPSKDIRTAFASILEKTMSCFFTHGGVSVSMLYPRGCLGKYVIPDTLQVHGVAEHTCAR